MVKKLLYIPFLLLFCFSLSFNAFCTEEGQEYYEEYDNYEEFENDYIDGYVADDIKPSSEILSAISIPAILIGAASGAAFTAVLLRKRFAAPRAMPHFRTPKQKNETVYENDTLIG